MGILQKTTELKINEKAQKDYWEQQFGTSYDIGEVSDENKSILKGLVKGIPIGKMLDNGCGDGRMKKFFEKLGWEVYGSDISRNAIVQASKVTPINLIVAVAEELPFKDSFFDVVFTWRVLHSLLKGNRIKAWQEIDRVLKKNGHLICSVQSIEDAHTIKKYMNTGIEHPNDQGSYVSDMNVEGQIVQRLKHFYSKEEIIKEIELNTALKVVNIDTYSEKAGWNNDMQIYWNLVANK